MIQTPLSGTTVPLALAPGVSREFLLRHRVCPLEVDATGSLVVAVGVTHAPTALEELAHAFGLPVTVTPRGDSELEQLIELTATAAMRAADAELVDEDDLSLEDVRELANQPPVARYVNLLVREAYDASASDIHLEATPEGLTARVRLDGVLQSAPSPQRALERAVISRLKAMADLDITERRRPQDGRMRIRLEERDLDVRISTVPTVHGESVVLRLLDRGGRPVALEALGMGEEVHTLVRAASARPHGMLLVTGPTGSGKTTTLYAALQRRPAAQEKIVTVEEPVEYQLSGVTQVPVQRQAQVTFASALRAILRQDPDVVMVGEMRDRETAEIAVQAAMTGHLVLSTLHTNDALGAIPRLVDLGVPAYLVAATLELVVAQRLVRKLCRSCAAETDVDASRVAALVGGPAVSERLWRAVGCDRCRGTGYRGRTGVFEAVRITENLRIAISAHDDVATLRSLAEREGLIPMRRHALALLRSGVTSIEEVVRAIQD